MSENRQTYFVCPAPPCPNGKLHLGHIGGVYLLADIFVRYQRMIGHVAYHVTGADEHGTYTLVKARKLGRSVDDVAQMHIDEILQCLRAVHIAPDVFVRTSSEEHKRRSLAIYKQLDAAGYIELRDAEQLYCESCDEFAADSLAVGKCPACNAAADSNLCENCGLAIQHSLLRDPVHTPCGHALTLRPIRQAHFNFERLAPTLDRAIEGSGWPDTIKHKEIEWLRTELRALPMSRHFDRGVTLVAPAEVAGQTLLTWFEGLWCFDTGIERICKQNGADYDDTMRSPDTKLLFFMGQDNRFYYTIGVTASLLARGYAIPHNHAIQDYYKLEGAKFSTGRDHAIWADEVARDIDPSVLRYYLARIAKAFGSDDNDFQIEGLVRAAARIHLFETALRKHAGSNAKLTVDTLKPERVLDVERYCQAMHEARVWAALDAIDAFFEGGGLARDEAGASATEISVFLSMLHPVVPVLAARYGAFFFGAGWRPGLDNCAVWPSADTLSVMDAPLFGEPIPDAFIAAYEQRFRAAPATT
ncbi:methionyl-tRNA synthetase [Mesorhizobium robiniae]|uniref:Methionyl-tRNA synthetase n=1 Tax=Mesorhizobium robiniae TaxID=559315 RepID=A0ABV2GZ19_9HYPH|nr:class I tRNA ligase family protein [Mesorhizobium sp. ZC-5]MCV3243622.1 class I tRNA ligase family protein [Mesorhizobium sp. ZC-5]